jgi:antitoxin YefM
MKETLDEINDTDETVIISRSEDRDVVLLSIRTYNSIQETLYQMSSTNNKKRLDKAILDIEFSRNLVRKELIV